MDPEVFDLVYEGFWDLYTFKPCLQDISARKLQTWIQKIKLQSGPDRAIADEEEKATPEDDAPAEAAGEGENEDEEEKND